MANSPVRSVVVDFDGTIVRQDVSEEILRAFAPAEWWDIDVQFQRGEIGSRECLMRQAALLTDRKEAMMSFAIGRFAVDPTFGPFVGWARGLGMEVVVASDGLGFYIEAMLRAAGIKDLPVLTNRVLLGDGRPVFAFPEGHSVCVGCGTCKMNAVLHYRKRRGPVAFVGEGHTDRYGALYADLVFATKHLREICLAEGIPFLPWETFEDVRSGLVATGPGGLPGPVDPAICPGWTVDVGGGTGI